MATSNKTTALALVNSVSQPFTDLVQHSTSPLTFAGEARFAVHCLEENAALLAAAQSNPNSFRRAMLQVAVTGLSLNPVLAECYLVPRKGKICFQPSYRGRMKVYIDSGSIEHAEAFLIHANDDYTRTETVTGPTLKHSYRFGQDRGPVIGGYVRTVLPGGRVMVNDYTAEEIAKRQAMSPTKSNNTPWGQWPKEMQLKTLINMESNRWPKRTAPALEALKEAPFDDDATPDPEQQQGPLQGAEQARNITPDDEPEGDTTPENPQQPPDDPQFAPPDPTAERPTTISGEHLEKLIERIAQVAHGDDHAAQLSQYICGHFGIKRLIDMPREKLAMTLAMLDDFARAHPKTAQGASA